MEKFMEEWFIENEKEFGGTPITKENYEDLFEQWLSIMGIDEWFKFGELYANSIKVVQKP